MELRGVQIGPVVKAEHRAVAVARPPRFPRSGSVTTEPKGRGRAGRSPETGRAGNTAVLPDPFPHLHVIGMGVLGESSDLSLLRSEKALLLSANSKSRRDVSR